MEFNDVIERKSESQRFSNLKIHNILVPGTQSINLVNTYIPFGETIYKIPLTLIPVDASIKFCLECLVMLSLSELIGSMILCITVQEKSILVHWIDFPHSDKRTGHFTFNTFEQAHFVTSKRVRLIIVCKYNKYMLFLRLRRSVAHLTSNQNAEQWPSALKICYHLQDSKPFILLYSIPTKVSRQFTRY